MLPTACTPHPEIQTLGPVILKVKGLIPTGSRGTVDAKARALGTRLLPCQLHLCCVVKSEAFLEDGRPGILTSQTQSFQLQPGLEGFASRLITRHHLPRRPFATLLLATLGICPPWQEFGIQ